MRLPKKLGFLPGGCVSALLLLLAFLQFQTQQQAYGLPEEWRTHFRVLLALSLALLLAIYLLPSRRGRLTACILRIVLFLITGIPFGRFLDVRYLMLFSVLLDINLALEGPLSLALSAGVLSCSAVFLLPLSVFSLRRPPPGPADLASFFVLGVALSGLLYCHRRLQRVNAESGQRVVALNDAVSRLIGANRDYLEYAARVARESTASERNRITLELHDVVGQAFTNIFAMMDASLKHPPAGQEEARGLHLLAREQAQKGLNETRAILYRLRSIEERELSGIHSLNNLVNTFSFSTKVKVRVEWGNLPWQVEPALDDVLYRVVQESLVNAFRHGKASQIAIRFWVSERLLILDIQDNGTGSGGAKKGIGQESMEQRVSGAGGRVAFGTNSQGYNVHAELPL